MCFERQVMQVPVGEFVAKVKFKAYEEPMIFEVMGFETTAGNNHYAPIVITESGVMTVRTEEFGQVEKVTVKRVEYKKVIL
jgi:hypothetical protein